MSTKKENLELDIAHFHNFMSQIKKFQALSADTIEQLLNMGVIEVSTAFELALCDQGGHEHVSLDAGDLSRNGKISDAKISSVRTHGYGQTYSAPVTNIHGKKGCLRVQVYERKQDKFYYFVFPRRTYSNIPKSSNIDIPFEMDGTPRTRNRCQVNWWNYRVDTFEEMALKDYA
jgi:hypothetical protein